MPGVFASTLRPAILAAARGDVVRRAAQRLPVTRRVVRRFVPGETIEPALNGVAALRSSGRLVSVDYLGEDVLSADDADAAVQAYLELIDGLGRLDAGGDAVRPLRSRSSCPRWDRRWGATGTRSRGRTHGRSAMRPGARVCG